VSLLRPGGREKDLHGQGRESRWWELRHYAKAQPVKKTRYPMYLLQILEQARARNVAEQYYLYTQSEEGRAAAIELDRLRAACDAAEAHYLATCSRCDAERAAEANK